MSQNYTDFSHSRYLVATVEGKVVGGCGIAPFNNSKNVCELKKLFLLPESRGLGLGRKLAIQCLEYAKSKGFESCYLDTLKNMTSAIALYERLGFKHLEKPLAGTEHNGCDVWMLKQL
jgi:putative acetyltransferase